MDFVPEENRKKLDLHSLNKDQASFEILSLLDTAPRNIYELVIVHGYSFRKHFKTNG